MPTWMHEQAVLRSAAKACGKKIKGRKGSCKHMGLGNLQKEVYPAEATVQLYFQTENKQRWITIFTLKKKPKQKKPKHKI